MNTCLHIVFHIRGFEHHSIQPFGLLRQASIAEGVADAVNRFCDDIGLVPVSITFRGESEGWQSFRVKLGTGREIEVHARETTAITVKVEG